MFKTLKGQIQATKLITSIDRKFFDIAIDAKITHGHGVASKPSAKYPDGTIQLQYPHFKALGLDLGDCYPGTLNLSIAPANYKIIKPRIALRNVDWFPARGQTEDFLIADCAIMINTSSNDAGCSTTPAYVFGYVYLPDPKTKIEHFDDPQALQIISPYLNGLDEKESVKLLLSSSQIELVY